jgi:hypothetical protein
MITHVLGLECLTNNTEALISILGWDFGDKETLAASGSLPGDPEAPPPPKNPLSAPAP